MRRLQDAGLVLIVVLVVLPTYLLRLNDAAGLMVDDAWYILLAKSLADGTGYRMINSPAPDVVPLYPPAFPSLLSLVFQISAEFPHNVWLLKSVSIAAMVGVGVLTYVYLRHRQLQQELAACAAIVVTITPAFVFLATSTVMSECVFTLIQLAAVVLIHRSVAVGVSPRGRIFTIAAALAVAANALIRSAGLGLALAVALWLVKERLWKRAMLFAVVVAVCLLPWMLYARAHAPTPEERLLHGGSIVYSYGQQIRMRWAGDPASGVVTVRDIPARVSVNIVDVFARGMGGIFVPAVFRGPAESGEEMVALGGAAGLGHGSMGSAGMTMAISIALSALVTLGFVQTARRRVTPAELLVPISLGIIFVWPFWTFRFVVPLAPYLFLYLVAGIQTLAPLRVARIALLCLIGLNVLDHARYVLEARDPDRSSRVSWLVQARETEEALDWMVRNLGDGVVATTNPALVYLRTGHKTLSFDRFHEDSSVWRARGVRYVVCLLAVELPSSSRIDFKLLYRTPSGFWVIELLTPAV
jgi:hypothetical protein